MERQPPSPEAKRAKEYLAAKNGELPPRYPVIPDEVPEGRRGDAHEPRTAPRRSGTQDAEPPPSFPEPIPASRLKLSEGTAWLWHGYLAPGSITMLSALWKAGKTTLIAHLLRALQSGGEFCGRRVEPARVLYVTEESEHRWAVRRDRLALKDHVSFLVRPFRGRPDWTAWLAFVDHLVALCRANPVDLLVLDPVVNLWPVRDENDNAQVLSALLPLHELTDMLSLLLSHHHRKSDGNEGTASRGAGSFMGFVDTIVEMRRHNAADRADRRRVLTGYGRDDDTPDEIVIELTEEGYVAHGDRERVAVSDLMPTIAGLLPSLAPGATRNEVYDAWPDHDARPGIERLLAALNRGVDEGTWARDGTGRRGSPWRFYRPAGFPATDELGPP